MTFNLKFRTSSAFEGITDRATPSDPPVHEFRLVPTRWDDYGYKSSFELYWLTEDGSVSVGWTKIGKLGTYAGFGTASVTTSLDDEFETIPEEFVSLGQDSEFYANLVRFFSPSGAKEVLVALGDISLRNDLRDLAASERVVWKSLLRTVTIETVEDQYRRIIAGGEEKDTFSLTYLADPLTQEPSEQAEFRVEPGSLMPGTLQVVIGSNGAGKTRMLGNIRRSLSSPIPSHVRVSDGKRLSGLVTVGFSAFDIAEDPSEGEEPLAFRVKSLDLSLLRGVTGTEEQSPQQGPFADLVEACASAGRADRLMRAIETLAQGDQLLNEHNLLDIESLKALDFDPMSSGHKIVLLTMAGLVAYCDDRTLILIDEPESHLHPPLLGSFITAIRDLIAATNSLAIVVTHSPVVLQQVPARHARKIWRSGTVTQFLAMTSETWGENLGRLTRAVFKVELERSGHYALLAEASRERTYEQAVDYLGNELGGEASLILQSLTDRTESP